MGDAKDPGDDSVAVWTDRSVVSGERASAKARLDLERADMVADFKTHHWVYRPVPPSIKRTSATGD